MPHGFYDGLLDEIVFNFTATATPSRGVQLQEVVLEPAPTTTLKAT